MLKLYYHPGSTYARRVVIALIEKRLDYEPVALAMEKGAHRQAEYLALNPYGRVPTIEEDGFVLYESTAILDYLEATRPDPALAPQDARGRALVDKHMKLCDIEMARPTVTIIFPKRFLPEERWDKAAMEAARTQIERHLTILERQLDGRAYLVGDTFTLADLCYLPFLEFLPLTEVSPPPAIAAWRERLLSRPSAEATRPVR